MTLAWKTKPEKCQVYHASSLNEPTSPVTNGLRSIGLSSLHGNQKTTTRILDVLFPMYESPYICSRGTPCSL
jgi:hypothetical protein